MGTKTKTLLYYLKNITEEAPTDKCTLLSTSLVEFFRPDILLVDDVPEPGGRKDQAYRNEIREIRRNVEP